MTPSKLTETEKQEILQRYQFSEESTSTLATHFGVSSTTITRVLKGGIPEAAYEAIVQRKRATARSQSPIAQGSIAGLPLLDLTDRVEPVMEQSELPLQVAPEAGVGADSDLEASDTEATTGIRRQRRRASAAIKPEAPAEAPDEQPIAMPVTSLGAEEEEEVTPVKPALEMPKRLVGMPILAESKAPALSAQGFSAPEVTQPLPADLLKGEEFADLDGEDQDNLEEDLDEEEDDDAFDDDEAFLVALKVQSNAQIQVLPLTEANLPKTLYLVVDRAAELITQPLKEFGELGQIPIEEIQEKTLPIFDNHRVARRFSKKTQRVVKVPDGKMLHKVSPYLQAKGITRLLIDGQVYSL